MKSEKCKKKSFLSFAAPFFKAALFCASIFFFSCGLEDYPYINPIPQSSVRQEMNNRAVVDLRGYGETISFSNFVIFYRIYVSDTLILSTTREQYQAINPTLASDYNAIYPYIDSQTLVNSNMDSLFGGRNYKYLEVQGGVDIDSLLSSGGMVLTFDFTSAKNPTMEINGGIYNLMRSNGNGSFTPLPADRLFIHRDELWAIENITAQTNADVVNKTTMNSPNRHTYAAMFIAAVGMDNTTLSYIYSTPALIHVFALPPQWEQ